MGPSRGRAADVLDLRQARIISGKHPPPTAWIPAKAIMIAILVQVIGGNVFVSVTGAMFWMLAGMYLAAGKYHIERS